MKKSLLLPLLVLLSLGLFAQKQLVHNADKNAPAFEPAPNLDLTPPTVTCLNGLSVNVMPTGAIQIWASDFLSSVSDNITPSAEIKIAVRKAGTGFGFPKDALGNPNQSVLFDCSQLGSNAVELWAKDLAGNTAHCLTNLILQDNMMICNGSQAEFDSVLICVKWGCNDEPMTGVSFDIASNPQWGPPPTPGFVSDSITGSDGCANIYYPVSISTFGVAPVLEDDPKNGLSTYDLLLLAKHILGIEPLDNPYKMIAADANKSNSLTTFDLVELRKLLLGIYDELPNNTTWRFVDGDFQFPNPSNPFQSAFPEFLNVQQGQIPDTIGFVGVKIGDLDCSALLNNGPAPDYPDVLLAMPDTVLQPGQVYDIPLYMVENGNWDGYQFSLNFDKQKLEYQSMTTHVLTGQSNWNFQQAAQGILTTSWFQMDVPGAFGPSMPIATIRFQALETVSLKDILTISDEILRPEAYTGWNAEKRDLILTFAPQLKPTPGDPNADKNAPIFEPGPNQDIIPPVITCLNGLSVNIMPTGAIQLWATDFLQSVSDNETPTDQIKIAIRKLGTGFGFPEDAQGNPVSSILYDCDELGTNAVELWAKDLGGNTAHCLAYTIVQDNLQSCGLVKDWLIEICAKTEASDGIEEAQYEVNGSNPNVPFYAIQVSGPNIGCGYFDVPLGSNVTAVPVKDDNPLNGVTSYDVVLISKHIQGIELLNSPYKMIAADADRNGVIDSTDIEEFWKLILGIYTELPNNTSWRFVDKSYAFPDPGNPFTTVFPESITVQNIQFPVSADFVGIKVGDVNGTAVANGTNYEVDERTMILESSSIGLPRPNPTFADAVLPIYLPIAENLRLELSDLTGKLLWVNDLQLEKGSHTLEIPASVMSGKGVYVWRIWAGEVAKAGKLVRL
ncbi:MAG: hypothetical protein ACKVU0_09015 [Saprospiraceae bacterium]